MLRTRVIPVLLMTERRLVKTEKFKNRIYLGDPINTVKIFNDKEVDELVIVDIDASIIGREQEYSYVEKLASQCFMPLAFGGGVRNAQQARRLLEIGVEKIVINSAAVSNPELISSLASEIGSQSVVVSVDVKKNWLGGYDVYTHGGTRRASVDLLKHVEIVTQYGAGEIVINSIDKDGTQRGYDTNLIEKVAAETRLPVIALGGAGSVADFCSAVQHGASAVAAGSMFVFKGPHKAVLINFPKSDELRVLDSLTHGFPRLPESN